MMIISKKRHIAKTISYRIISTLIGTLLVAVLTGSYEIGLTFSIAEMLYKPIQYYVHERVWYKYIRYGVKE